METQGRSKLEKAVLHVAHTVLINKEEIFEGLRELGYNEILDDVDNALKRWTKASEEWLKEINGVIDILNELEGRK